MSVGGSVRPGESTSPEECVRDGRGRLTIPGSSLAGALVETAARLFKGVLAEGPGNSGASSSASPQPRSRLTAKLSSGAPQRKAGEAPTVLLESALCVHHAHVQGEEPATEWRQGVGIRQATGATAREKRALFDVECVPVGTRWSLALDIDTLRGGPELEALVVLALAEWCRGRCWLGRNPARGMGWARLEVERVVRLLCKAKQIECWPDATRGTTEALQQSVAAGALEVPWDRAVEDGRQLAAESGWQPAGWSYLVIDAVLGAGLHSSQPSGGNFGLDPLHVGGHPVGAQAASRETVLRPLSLSPGQPSEGSDRPLVQTVPIGSEAPQPFLPGSGLRGPIRHVASAIVRRAGGGRSESVLDPNSQLDSERHRKQMLQSADASARSEVDRRRLAAGDAVLCLFGSEFIGSRLLVRDAKLVSEADGENPGRASTDVLVAIIQHHAEDEFTAGPFASSKFDSTCLLRGRFECRLVVEIPPDPALGPTQLAGLGPLASALSRAELGHLPIGGLKWRGAGWIRWTFRRLAIEAAGGATPLAVDDADPRETGGPGRVVARLRALFERLGSPTPDLAPATGGSE